MAEITEPRDKVRLLIGDTVEDEALYNDNEIDFFLAERAGNVLLAAADACEALARRFARRPKFETDNQSFDFTSSVRAYRELAADLRARASGVTSVSSTRVDGYSQDITNVDVSATSTTGRRRYGGEPDAPF